MPVIFYLAAIAVAGVLTGTAFIWIVERQLTTRSMERSDFWSGMGAFLLFSAIVMGVWLLAWWLLPYLYTSPDGVGEAGDMFGGVTALFSGLAFAGLISTLLMQRKELELQRSELKQSREEFRLQRFENTLFGMIKLLNDHISSIERTNIVYYRDAPVTKVRKGREILKEFAMELPDELDEPVQAVTSGESGPRSRSEKRHEMSEQLSVYSQL